MHKNNKKINNKKKKINTNANNEKMKIQQEDGDKNVKRKLKKKMKKRKTYINNETLIDISSSITVSEGSENKAFGTLINHQTFRCP